MRLRGAIYAAVALLALGVAAGASAQATVTVTKETMDVSGFAFVCPTEVVRLSGTATETIRLTQSGVRFSQTDVFKMDGATGVGRTTGTVYRVTGVNVITLTGPGNFGEGTKGARTGTLVTTWNLVPVGGGTPFSLQVTFHTTQDPLGNFHADVFETHLDCF
jgi:hypothetical protein